jgi:hypothetical protein
MKYSDNFERDYNWYLKYGHIYKFDGSLDPIVIYDEHGKDAKYCFYKYDSTGKLPPTNQPNLLVDIIKAKRSINFHIKMWAEGVAERISFMSEFMNLDLLDWQIKAIKRQADRIGYKDWEGRLQNSKKYTNRIC